MKKSEFTESKAEWIHWIENTVNSPSANRSEFNPSWLIRHTSRRWCRQVRHWEEAVTPRTMMALTISCETMGGGHDLPTTMRGREDGRPRDAEDEDDGLSGPALWLWEEATTCSRRWEDKNPSPWGHGWWPAKTWRETLGGGRDAEDEDYVHASRPAVRRWEEGHDLPTTMRGREHLAVRTRRWPATTWREMPGGGRDAKDEDDGCSRPAVRRWEATICPRRWEDENPWRWDDGRPRPDVRRWEEAVTLGWRGRDAGCEDKAATLCMWGRGWCPATTCRVSWAESRCCFCSFFCSYLIFRRAWRLVIDRSYVRRNSRKLFENVWRQVSKIFKYVSTVKVDKNSRHVT